MHSEKIFLFKWAYPYFSYEKIINETKLHSSIPNSFRQITSPQHCIHCVNYETILFEQHTLQLIHLFFNSWIFYLYNICKTPLNFYIFLSVQYLQYELNSSTERQNTKQFKGLGKKAQVIWRTFWEALWFVDVLDFSTFFFPWVFALLSSNVSFPPPQDNNSHPLLLP